MQYHHELPTDEQSLRIAFAAFFVFGAIVSLVTIVVSALLRRDSRQFEMSDETFFLVMEAKHRENLLSDNQGVVLDALVRWEECCQMCETDPRTRHQGERLRALGMAIERECLCNPK
jgi:hypothetical protein